jgi:transcriptional regulator with XRE-family HTH domain
VSEPAAAEQHVIAEPPPLGDLPGLIRRVRRISDLSQRELASRAGVSAATVNRIETGTLVPRLPTLQRLLASADLRLVVIDAYGHVVAPMRTWQDLADDAGRRYPAHLDTVIDPRPGEWWADIYGLARPPETFRRNRAIRDQERRRSQWEVRVAQHRSEPPPPDPRYSR